MDPPPKSMSEDRVAIPIAIVGSRMIHGEMETSALLACLGARDDQPRDLRDVSKLDQVPRQVVAPVVFADLAAHEREAPSRALQPPMTADDTHVIPHEPPDLIPALGDHHGLVLVRRQPRAPLGHLRLPIVDGIGLSLEGAGGGAMSEDEGLQEAVRRESVGAMQPGEGHLTAREETRDRRLPVEIGDDAAASCRPKASTAAGATASAARKSSGAGGATPPRGSRRPPPTSGGEEDKKWLLLHALLPRAARLVLRRRSPRLRTDRHTGNRLLGQ